MRREIERLYALGGRKLTGWLLLLPWHCLSCAHVRIPQDVDSPRAFRALATHKVACAQGRELPQYGRRCPGFTRAKTTKGNERPQQATNGLPSSADCCTIRAPENYARRHKSLSDFPRVGRMLVLHLLSTPADFSARCLHILGRLQRLGSREAPAVSHRPGSVVACPFCFPILCEVQNV